MALDFLKSKKAGRSSSTAPTAEKPAEKPAKDSAPAGKPKRKARTRTKATVFGVIRGVHLTEKSSANADLRQYAFRVAPDATKPQVAQAVGELYGVHAEDVRILNVPGKTIRRGRREGRRPGYKKALVSIRKGEKIEVFS